MNNIQMSKGSNNLVGSYGPTVLKFAIATATLCLGKYAIDRGYNLELKASMNGVTTSATFKK